MQTVSRSSTGVLGRRVAAGGPPGPQRIWFGGICSASEADTWQAMAKRPSDNGEYMASSVRPLTEGVGADRRAAEDQMDTETWHEPIYKSRVLSGA